MFLEGNNMQENAFENKNLFQSTISPYKMTVLSTIFSFFLLSKIKTREKGISALTHVAKYKRRCCRKKGKRKIPRSVLLFRFCFLRKNCYATCSFRTLTITILTSYFQFRCNAHKLHIEVHAKSAPA